MPAKGLSLQKYTGWKIIPSKNSYSQPTVFKSIKCPEIAGINKT